MWNSIATDLITLMCYLLVIDHSMILGISILINFIMVFVLELIIIIIIIIMVIFKCYFSGELIALS